MKLVLYAHVRRLQGRDDFLLWSTCEGNDAHCDLQHQTLLSPKRGKKKTLKEWSLGWRPCMPFQSLHAAFLCIKEKKKLQSLQGYFIHIFILIILLWKRNFSLRNVLIPVSNGNEENQILQMFWNNVCPAPSCQKPPLSWLRPPTLDILGTPSWLPYV